ncbi:hypothetical protein Tco_0111055 [Tanacetum coccineum]
MNVREDKIFEIVKVRLLWSLDLHYEYGGGGLFRVNRAVVIETTVEIVGGGHWWFGGYKLSCAVVTGGAAVATGGAVVRVFVWTKGGRRYEEMLTDVRLRWDRSVLGCTLITESRVTCGNTNENTTLSEAHWVSLRITSGVRINRLEQGVAHKLGTVEVFHDLRDDCRIVYHDLFFGEEALEGRNVG